MIDLLIKNNVLINVSYDGPYNSVLRQNSDKVLENIMKIKSKNGKLRCFCTLSKDSYEHLYEIYDWFKKNKIDFKTSPVEKFGYAEKNTKILIDVNSLVETMTNVYRYWIKDKESTIRYFTFEEFASLRRNKQFKHYWFNSKIALNPDGNMYPFGRPNDVHYSLGKPSEIESIDECFEKDSYKKLLKILKNHYNKICTECESIGVCNGVAFNMAYMYTNNDDILMNGCFQSNKIFNSILKVNTEIIDDFKNGKFEQYNETVIKKFKDFIPM